MNTPARTIQKIRLGDLLVEHRIIAADQLQRALAEQKKSGLKLGRTLIDMGVISERQMMEFLSQHLGLELIDLRNFEFDLDAVRKLPETLARRFRAIVLKNDGTGFLVGMADPTDIFAYDEISKNLGTEIHIALVSEDILLRTFDTVYRRTEEISTLAQELDEEFADTELDIADIVASAAVADAPVVKLLQSVFVDAVQQGASDIHIEPDESVLRLRLRVDGVLQEQVIREKRIANALVLRLKLMASLNISEKRLPQDGRFNIKVKGKSIDVRVSTMPIQYGESVVMRLLDQSGEMLELERLGMPENVLERFRQVLKIPNGMILVTGPTGSGKTTTLYASLRELNEPDVKIITVEDPVEYRLPRVNQVGINAKIGLEFSTVLRAALRQDPDVILVGEMRDQETAEIGLRAAMTGHLVLSTLHTNDAPSAADRLLDMGAQGFLLAASLRVIIAQRLIRKVCEHCSAHYEPTPHDLTWLRQMRPAETEGYQLKAGKGCTHCAQTGYRGRIGVYEFLEPTPEMLDALRRSSSNDFVRGAARAPLYKSLGNSALDHALQGETTLDEAKRVSGAWEAVSPSPSLS